MEHRPGTFVIDKNYLRTEARAGLKSFFAPFSGVYLALVGSDLAYKKAKLPKKKPSRMRYTHRANLKRAARKRA